MTRYERQTPQLLADLHLKGMDQALDQELQRAETEGAPAADVIQRLLIQEQIYRQERNQNYRLKQARIPWDWTLKTFPFDQQPGVSKAQIQQLAGPDFLERKENIVFIGGPGTGKSGLASGLLRQALLSGYRGRFYHGLAVESDRSGRAEVYLRRVSGGPLVQVSPDGGQWPRLRPDGRALYFLGPSRRLYEAPLTPGQAGLTAGRPRPLGLIETTGLLSYDVAPDGRILVVRRLAGGADSFHVLLGWRARVESEAGEPGVSGTR